MKDKGLMHHYKVHLNIFGYCRIFNSNAVEKNTVKKIQHHCSERQISNCYVSVTHNKLFKPLVLMNDLSAIARQEKYFLFFNLHNSNPSPSWESGDQD